MKNKPKKGDWVYIPGRNLAGIVLEDVDQRSFVASVVVVGKDETTGKDMEVNGVPLLTVLAVVLDALVIISKIAPVIDGLLPYIKRWWREIFGTPEEKAAIMAFKRAKRAEKAMKEYLNYGLKKP